jgi:hypothetical protein
LPFIKNTPVPPPEIVAVLYKFVKLFFLAGVGRYDKLNGAAISIVPVLD